MDRRQFLKQGGAVVAGGLLADLGIFEQAAGAARRTHRQPNIVFILVDEMRFPTVSPPACISLGRSCSGTCRTCSTCGVTE